MMCKGSDAEDMLVIMIVSVIISSCIVINIITISITVTIVIIVHCNINPGRRRLDVVRTISHKLFSGRLYIVLLLYYSVL